MKPIRVAFTPPPGIILSETSFSLPGQWSAGNNVRPDGDRMQPIGGWDTINAATGVDGTATNLHEWFSNNGTRYLIIGHTAGCEVLSGSSLGSATDIIYGGFTSATRWSFANYGEQPLACPAGGTLYYWDLNTANNLVAISNAPDNITVIGMDDETGQVMAFGANEETSGTFNPRCIRTSGARDRDLWTTTASNIAREYILQGQGGQIRAAKKVGAGWAVWTDTELFYGLYQGDLAQPWRWNLIATGCGALGPDTVTVADGVAYWISRDLRPMMWAPGATPIEIGGLPTSYITGDTLSVDKNGLTNAFTWHNRKFNEIWFHLVVSGQTYPTIYVAVNVDSLRTSQPQWFPGTMSRSVIYQGAYQPMGFSFGSGSAVLREHEVGKNGQTGQLLTCSISAWVYMGEGEQRVQILRMIPDIKDQAGTLTCTITSYRDPQGSAIATKTISLAAGQDKADFSISGNLFKIEFSSNDGTGATDTFWRLGRCLFEFVGRGRY